MDDGYYFQNSHQERFLFGRTAAITGYEALRTGFRMYHKLSVVMGQRDERYRLVDMVKYDEAFIGKATKAKVRSQRKPG